MSVVMTYDEKSYHKQWYLLCPNTWNNIIFDDENEQQ